MRRTAAGVLAGALALSGAVAAGTPAFAATGFALERVAGNDRYETSANIAAAFGPATSIILASGESGRTPDALAASFLAGVRNAPVLLTRRDTTPEPILSRLAALRTAGATRITVVGGPVAVSDAQITALRAQGFTVDRVAGANRYETAAEIAEEGETGEAQEASNIGIIASGVSTIDALAGGPLAFKGRHPLFLVTRDGVPGATLAALRSTGVTSVFVLGGEAVVGPRVVAQLSAAGITVRERLAGANRSETSVAIANRLIADFGFSPNTFNLASGINEGIDALGGAALSGKENRVILITNTANSAAPVVAFATARAATLNVPGRIFGGIAAVTAGLETQIETAGGSTGPTVSATVRPELQSAAITGTVVTGNETAANPVGTSVRYTFDEVVTAPQLGSFVVYTSAGARTTATAVTLETGGRSVLARFAGFNTTALAADLTVATVEMNAVLDLEGNGSPEGDAAIGTAVPAGGAGALPAGITDGPDLLTVGNFRAAAADTQTAVDFTFDEAATLVGDVTGFNLVTQNGTVLPATPIATLPFGSTSGGTAQGGNNTTTFTLVFTNPNGNTDIVASDVNRGYVTAGSVRDTASPTPNQNVTQAADVSGGTATLQPDLVSVAFRPSADTTGDQVLFTFDQPVNAATAANFVLYQADGDLVTGATGAVINTANAAQVLVTFADQALVDVVGAQALAGAVTSASLTQPNRIDEEGAAGTSAASSGRTPGATAGPDLTGVALATTTDAFGNVGNFQATYTFDADVAGTAGGALAGAGAAVAKFKLYLANGTMLTANGATIGSTEATDNTVVVTFAGAAGTAPTSATVGSATLGTVDDGAVQGTGTATTISGAGVGATNPEGAALTTGGTGTRVS